MYKLLTKVGHKVSNLIYFVKRSPNSINLVTWGVLIHTAVNWTMGLYINRKLFEIYGFLPSLFLNILVTIIISSLVIYLYDKSRKDWLAIEKLKVLKDTEPKPEDTKIILVIKKAMIKGDKFVLLVLVVKYPIIFVIYARKGAYKFDGFQNRTIIILFIISSILVNIIWNTVLFTGFSLWSYCKHLLF